MLCSACSSRTTILTSTGGARPEPGPVFLIYDVDNLRYLFGEIVAVQARESNAASDLRKDPNA
jgi:hypothetical protein